MNCKSIFILLFLMIASNAQAQIGGPEPYPGYPCATNIAIFGKANASSTEFSSIEPSVLIDNQNDQSSTVFSTRDETNPYIDIDLLKNYDAVGAKIFKLDANELQDFYIFFSAAAFTNYSLQDLITSPFVQYIHVSSNEPNGTFFDLPAATEARYVRIQLVGSGSLDLLEIEVPALHEICGNGSDDDCDGLTDCNDPECSGFINQTDENHRNPTCPICNNGEIDIYGQAFNVVTTPWGSTQYNQTLYSIDGGQTYQSSRFFKNLDEGAYNLQIKNPVTGCVVAHPGNPVLLTAPPGEPQSTCENGDFESGSFTFWETTFGTIEDGGNQSGQPANRFRIVSGTDPLTGTGRTFQGTYAAQLGNPTASSPSGAGSGQVSKLSYTLVADDNNNPLQFGFAAVIQDGGDANFACNIYVKQGANYNLIQSISVNADDPDMYTLQNGNTAIKYSGWRCVSVDLSGHIGKEVKIEFITTESTGGDKFVYAFVDGVCLSPENAGPLAVIDLNDVYCQNQMPIASGQESQRFNAYRWKVCRLNPDGSINICKEGQQIPKNQVEDLDIIEFLQDIGWLCGYSYEVTLTLYSDCSAPVSLSKRIMTKCSQSNVTYKDIVICNNNYANNVQIETAPGFDCNGCTYSWTPAAGLYNPNSMQPTIQGTNVYAGNAFNNDYTVRATNPDGCVYEDVVSTLKVTMEYHYLDNEDEFCEYNVQGSIMFNIPIDPSYFTTEFIAPPAGTTHPATLVSNTDNTMYVYRHPSNFNKSSPHFSIFKFLPNFPLDKFKVLGSNCSKTLNIPVPDYLLYYGDFNIAIPNAFTPNGDGVNDEFGPIVVPSLGPEYIQHNAIRGTLTIYNRWGDEVFDTGWQEGTPTTPFDINLLRWDGGPNPVSDTYVYILKLINCTEGEMIIHRSFALLL